MAKKRPDPADFRFENKSGEVLVREPGQVDPYDFQIDSLNECEVYLMDKIAEVKVDKVTNSRLHFGPVESSCFLRDCSNCTVTVACSQLRTKNCKDLRIFLYCGSDPSLEMSTDITIGPYNFSYPLQDQHFQKAGLNIGQDMWSQVYDFNAVEGETHWRIMDPSQFAEMQWTKDELGGPVNPVPRHVSYGGTLSEDIPVGSVNHGTQGMLSFNIQTSQAKAEEMMGDPFSQGYGELQDQPSDPFGSDPFGGSADPFAGNADPFAAAADPFAGGGQQEIPQHEDPEEAERQRLRDQEHQERMKKLYEKDEKERTQKEANRLRAKEELAKWYDNRNKETERRKQNNIDEEQQRKNMMKQYEQENPWKKVGTMLDFKEANERKELARMRSVLLAKKHEG